MLGGCRPRGWWAPSGAPSLACMRCGRTSFTPEAATCARDPCGVNRRRRIPHAPPGAPALVRRSPCAAHAAAPQGGWALPPRAPHGRPGHRADEPEAPMPVGPRAPPPHTAHPRRLAARPRQRGHLLHSSTTRGGRGVPSPACDSRPGGHSCPGLEVPASREPKQPKHTTALFRCGGERQHVPAHTRDAGTVTQRDMMHYRQSGVL